MTCGIIKKTPINTPNDYKEQTGAPCPIGLLPKATPSLNYISTPNSSHNRQPATPKKSPKPRTPQNIIKIRMDGVPKDIVIRFGDKETLMNTLKATILLLTETEKKEH